MAEGYNGIRKKKERRAVALTEIDVVDEYRRAFGVYQLIDCMNKKPEPGKSYHILTGGKVDLLAHVMWLMLFYKMKRLFISAWAISGNDILMLEKLQDEGKFESVEILVGDIFSTKYKFEWEKLKELEERGVVNAVFQSTIHAKILLMEATDGTKIVIESSANCNMNPRIEQSCVTVSEKLFDFYWVYIHNQFDEDLQRKTRMLEIEERNEERKNGKTRKTNNSEGLTLFGQDFVDESAMW